MNNRSISEALVSLLPGAQWVLRGDTIDELEWLDEGQSQPTDEQITAEIERQANAPIVPTSISDRQFFQQLAVAGIISEADALASNAAVIPPALLAIIATMPTDEQFSVKMLVSGATTFERSNPVTIAIGTAYGMQPAEIDAFFIAAGKL